MVDGCAGAHRQVTASKRGVDALAAAGGVTKTGKYRLQAKERSQRPCAIACATAAVQRPLEGTPAAYRDRGDG